MRKPASWRAPLKSGLLLALALSVAPIAAGCGGGGNSSSNAATTKAPASSSPASSAPAAASTTAAPASSPAKSASGLSGTWSGHYGGAFSGTFKLKWRQSGSNLHGNITLSAPNGTSDINGTVGGGKIRFGTVGSQAITYTGSVSGKSMSGSYKTPQGGGPWSATKSP
jgi:hypothetical protein